jgi:hypothetical protein
MLKSSGKDTEEDLIGLWVDNTSERHEILELH